MNDSRIAVAGRILCLSGAIIGALGLVGWLSGARFFTTIFPAEPPMMPNTAVGLVLLGVAGALRRDEPTQRIDWFLSMGAALAAFATGAATLGEYVLGIDLGIDRLVTWDTPGPDPGRPSPLAALACTLLGAALLVFDTRPRARARPSEWLVLLAGLVGLVGLLGAAFGAGPLYRLSDAPAKGIALPTAVALLLLSTGLLLERPRAGVIRMVVADAPGAMLVRRLLPVIVLGPILFKVMGTQLLRSLGIYDVHVTFAMVVGSMILVGFVILLVTAEPVNRAYAEVDTARARIRSLVDHAPEGIFIADLDGNLIDVNEAACKMLGYGYEELMEKRMVDIIATEEIARLLRAKRDLLTGGTQVDEWRLRRKDGSHFAVEVGANILPDGRWQAFVRDIDERKRLQRRFELALWGADLASWDWNVASGDLIFDARWAEMRGFRKDEIGPHFEWWKAGVHPDDWPHVWRALQDHFTGKTPHYESEHRVCKKNGDFICVLDRGKVSERDETGRPTRMLGTELEITERKRLEEELRRAVQEREDLLGIVAHDLRNPLSTILMSATLLKRAGGENDWPSRRPAVTIERAALRMSRLIQDLLDATRIEAGHLPMELTSCEVEPLVDECLASQGPMASSSFVELRSEVTRDVPAIFADRHRLLQVFENLVGNALKFTQPGGRITVGAKPTDGEVRLWVRDTGVGIAEKNLPRVFDKFWHAGQGLRGAGLGLPIAKGIVEAHGGSIWVESIEGRGTTFFFTIPIGPRAARRPKPSPDVAVFDAGRS